MDLNKQHVSINVTPANIADIDPNVFNIVTFLVAVVSTYPYTT